MTSFDQKDFVLIEEHLQSVDAKLTGLLRMPGQPWHMIADRKVSAVLPPDLHGSLERIFAGVDDDATISLTASRDRRRRRKPMEVSISYSNTNLSVRHGKHLPELVRMALGRVSEHRKALCLAREALTRSIHSDNRPTLAAASDALIGAIRLARDVDNLELFASTFDQIETILGVLRGTTG